MTCRSLRSSLRMVKWNDFPGSSFMVTSSGRSEPPELLDGESVAFASMSANPEKFFSLLPQTLGVGSFGPINAAVINDYDGLCECVDEGTREWLREERPCVAVQIIELGQLDEKKTAKVMDELECLIGVPRHASLPRVVGTFSLMRNQLWAVTDACISKEQASSTDEPVTLADFIKVAGGSLEPTIIKRVMTHIAGGLAHLHSRSWIHLNVHTRAILHNTVKNTYTLSSYKSVVFCETNKTCSPPPPTPMSQLMFVPSEHHGKKGLPNSAYCSHKSDVYALGVCGAIMQGVCVAFFIRSLFDFFLQVGDAYFNASPPSPTFHTDAARASPRTGFRRRQPVLLLLEVLPRLLFRGPFLCGAAPEAPVPVG